MTALTMYLIYKFGKSAVKNWDAPPRVSEFYLAEKHLENSLFALSTTQLRLILKRQVDHFASEAESNWKEKITEPPKPVETKDLLKDMLVSSIRELRFPDNGWRDEGKMWIGEILGISLDKTKTAIAFVFDTLPNEKTIKDRIDFLKIEKNSLEKYRFFALYPSKKIKGENENDFSELLIYNQKIEILSSRRMIINGLDLINYALELITTFENTHVGGTKATLKNSFVDLNIEKSNKPSTIEKLDLAISNWLLENSNGHLAITGEYGQGKSTALMKFCVDWARRFLETGSIGERVPLLIELRGQNPSENDPLSFISSWCTRYHLIPHQVMNLIKAGDAIVIFEGFDELRNAGKAYHRHQHFNALWKFAYPNTKLIFTGRPNFFLDDEEVNRTLRNQTSRITGGDCYTEVWEIQKLDIEKIIHASRSYEENVKIGIISSIKTNKDFLDIVSRPSMLPVVATIWPEIEELQKNGAPLTGAKLIEKYIQAVFSRKEAELEKDRVHRDAPSDSRYLLLPKQVLELLTICVAWRMSGLKYKNTIPRSEISDMIRDTYESVISMGKSNGVSPEVAQGIIAFEKRYETETPADRVEAMTAEVCSAGLLVPDTAGGTTNLRFPHKQFFEFLITKAIVITTDINNYKASQIILKCSTDSNIFNQLKNEQNTINYLSDCIGPNFKQILFKSQKLGIKYTLFNELIENTIKNKLNLSTLKIRKKQPENKNTYSEDEYVFEYLKGVKKVNFSIYFFTSFFLSLFFLTPIFLLTPELTSEYIIKHDSIISFVIIPLCSISGALSISLQLTYRDKSYVLLSLMRAHWQHSKKIPKNRKQELILAIRSVSKGEVYDPEGLIKSSDDYSQFVYPAKYFGKS
tara:strand:- start:1876 stop:4470 length:2595 start_codon:yes stop_codon:yes gene_type:complete